MKKPSLTAQQVKKYYDHNTEFFLSLGTGKKNKSIHRAVWGAGVKNRDEAQEYANKLILQALKKASTSSPPEILDLGCGVGSTLFYLNEHFAGKAKYTGVTISNKQVAIAKDINQKLGYSCQFMQADFLQLPPLPPINFAYAIEAFIHAPDAASFFEESARVLEKGGKLVLIDDFLTEKGNYSNLPAKQKQWLEDVAKGWMAGSLITTKNIEKIALTHRLKLTENQDLTPHLELRRPRDQFIEVLVKLLGKLAYHSQYFRSLRGGDALQKCLLNGLLEYRMLVFEKL